MHIRRARTPDRFHAVARVGVAGDSEMREADQGGRECEVTALGAKLSYLLRPEATGPAVKLTAEIVAFGELRDRLIADVDKIAADIRFS